MLTTPSESVCSQETTIDCDRVYGLDYASSLLDSLPKLSTSTTPPVYVLSTQVFADLHLKSTVAHAPDKLLFPFLHGLEGDNHAQILFFKTGAVTPSTSSAEDKDKPEVRRAKPPKYRGLLIVACTDDMQAESGEPRLEENGEDEVDGYSSDYSDDMDMDIDSIDSGSEVGDLDEDPQTDTYMHPVAMRTNTASRSAAMGSASVTLQTKAKPHPSYTPEVYVHATEPPSAATQAHERRTSANSSSTSSNAPSSDSRKSTSTAGTSLPSSPQLHQVTVVEAKEEEEEEELPMRLRSPVTLTSSMSPEILLQTCADGKTIFSPPCTPPGISLRNFGIQVPIYATLCDVVIYSPKGLSPAACTLASRFREAVSHKLEERIAYHSQYTQDPDLSKEFLEYNVFILDANSETILSDLPHLVQTVDLPRELGSVAPPAELVGAASTAKNARSNLEESTSLQNNIVKGTNTVDFARREKEEMRELTRASEIITIFPAGSEDEDTSERDNAIKGSTTATFWDPLAGQVFLGNSTDVPLAPPIVRDADDDPFVYLPTNAPADGAGYDVCIECHERAPFPTLAHLRAAEAHLEALDAQWAARYSDSSEPIPVRPPPNANTIIHLPCPSSPAASASAVAALLPLIQFIERCIMPRKPPSATVSASNVSSSPSRRWSPVAALFPISSAFASSGFNPTPASVASTPHQRSRPLKLLLYSSDGYTESSVPALALIMAVYRLTLPEAYLTLQIEKRRSFFVYQADLGVLRRIESRLQSERDLALVRDGGSGGRHASGSRAGNWSGSAAAGGYAPRPTYNHRPPATSISVSVPNGEIAYSPLNQCSSPISIVTSDVQRSRPRASTSPWLPSLFDSHQTWFNDPRFDGSFPSRVLPFLYLGNLNHASNAYMLHALGVTHVVSVGECALVPPANHGQSHHTRSDSQSTSSSRGSKSSARQGSLWLEEREGRIKVLDIKNVCDDGIDTLEPQLEPICNWIDEARLSGGHILVHCRVGVSRSATVVIAYVMKHLSLPLVDAYLLVRSRRLSVLIQPNMRLLYNLCGWEIRLARERAGNDEERLRMELSRTISWPYLAKEVHALNEKYLH